VTGRTGPIALLLVNLALIAAVPALARKAPKPAPPAAPAVLPRLVDLGAGKCIPCKRMAPILEALKIDYAGAVNVQFIDVWKDPKAGKPYGIRLIPTQVFFDRTGRERFRHEGFFGREDIEQIFRDSLGVVLRPTTK
jgi:thioredoxin 1